MRKWIMILVAVVLAFLIGRGTIEQELRNANEHESIIALPRLKDSARSEARENMEIPIRGPASKGENRLRQGRDGETRTDLDSNIESCRDLGNGHLECVFKENLDLASIVFDKHSNTVELESSITVLQSSNLNQIMLGVMRDQADFIEKSEQLSLDATQYLQSSRLSIGDARFACNDSICVARVSGLDSQSWKDFEEEFLDNLPNVGNTVISPMVNAHGVDEIRALIFFGGGMSVKL